MSKETDFLIYCMERYRYYKRLTGAQVAQLFEKYKLYDYGIQYFESLHTMSDSYIVEDVDEYIANQS